MGKMGSVGWLTGLQGQSEHDFKTWVCLRIGQHSPARLSIPQDTKGVECNLNGKDPNLPVSCLPY